MESKTTVEKTITINALPLKVWKVLTTPELIKEWLTDIGIEVISDFKVGNPIIFSGKWYGVKREDHGIILEFEPEILFRYSYWSKISRLPDAPENYTVMEFRLTSKEDQTILNLIHSNLTWETGWEHSNYYWGVTLTVIKKLAEG